MAKMPAGLGHCASLSEGHLEKLLSVPIADRPWVNVDENLIASQKREHSRKPDELYPIIEACSPGPYVGLFARGTRAGWQTWGNQANSHYRPNWPTYKRHSAVVIAAE